MIRFSLRRDSEVALGSPKVVAVGDCRQTLPQLNSEESASKGLYWFRRGL